MNTQTNLLQQLNGQTKVNGSYVKLKLWWYLSLWYSCTKENNEPKEEYPGTKSEQKIVVLINVVSKYNA